MEGKVVEIHSGMYKVECDGVIYNTKPTFSLRIKHSVKVGDTVILDSSSFLIIEVL